MNIDFAPSPLRSPTDHNHSTNGIFFELEPLLSKTNNLFEAAANGQVDDIQSYLSTAKNKADILDQNGDSALHHAARMNRVRVIDFMLNAGASVDVYSIDGFTPLHVAARSNAIDALDALLKRGAKPNSVSKYSGCTSLHFAAQFGHAQIIHRLLNEKDLDTDATDQQGMTALHVAINRGYEEICKELVNNGACVTMTTAKGQTCLHLAAASGSTNIVTLIVKSAVRNHMNYPGNAILSIEDVPDFHLFVNQKDASQNSALHLAVQSGTVSMCQVLLKHGADINIQNKCLHTPLHAATVRKKNKEMLELLIKRGGQTNSKDDKQRTPLHSAASFGNPECVKILLRNFASVDPKDANGMTPFLCAVAAGQTDCTELLLEAGADITAREKFQRSCIHLAVEHEEEGVLKTLLQKSGSGLANVPDVSERTALHYAASSSNIRLLDILLEKKTNCLLRDGDGKTPLHIAAETGKSRYVNALAKASQACVFQKDSDERSPLHFAALNGQGKVCSILFQMGAEVDSTDSYGWTPLLFAAKNGSAGIIRMFLELNAKIDHEDQTGNTALLIASAKGHVDAVKLLLDRQASLKPADDGLNCLDVAIEYQHADVVMAIIKNSRWRDVLSAKSPDGENRMGKLIEWFPDAAQLVMDRCIQRSLAQRSITYDFRLLDPGPDDQSGPHDDPFFGLVDMVNHKRKELLVHDLSRKLLKIKWRTYGWFVFWTNLIFFSFFLFLMTYFMLTQRKKIKLKSVKEENDLDDIFESKEAFNNVSPYLILAFVLFHLAKELYQIVLLRMEYFKQLTNLLEWTLYLSTTIFILPYVSSSFSSLRGDPRVTWQIGTVAVFLGYMNLILFMQTLDQVGIYVTLFYQVGKTFLKAITFFAMFALAFSVVFFILFKEQDAFASFDMAVMQVIAMTIGEIDYNTLMVSSLTAKNPETNAPLLPYRESSTLFVGIFIFAMPIILTNLLVGLAVGDIESVQKYAFLRNKGKFINFVVGVERKFPKWITRRFHRPEMVVTGRKVERKIWAQKFTFEDTDLGHEDHRSENEDEQRLAMLTKELAKAKQRQTSIIDTMHDQMNILLDVAAKVGVETRYSCDVHDVPRDANH